MEILISLMPFLTSATTPVREALRQAISPHHSAASDAGLLARLREPDMSLDEYDQILVRFHALHDVLGQCAPASHCAPWLAYYHLALRLNALEKDMSARHLQPSAKARAAALSIFSNPKGPPSPPLWAGRAYILVGSLMGAKVIRKALADSLQISEHNGGGFFFREPQEQGGRLSAVSFFELLETTGWSGNELNLLCGAAADFMRAHAEYWRLPIER